ncbi:MAG TPA: cytochrome c-type biogenesis protein CcmH [Gaiellaceae bacterium]|nr:cytochrome c-type biogenesis protein CcmH [Gaiellaceae bacterium]
MRLVLVAVAALAFAGPAAAACPTLADLEGEVMCPQCKTTLDQSDAPVARDIKRFIERRAEACVSEGQIKDELVAQFGPAVLAAPPREGLHWLAWLLPLIGLVVGGVVVSALVWRWSRGRTAAEPEMPMNGRPPLDPELERRLDRELARFDG